MAKYPPPGTPPEEILHVLVDPRGSRLSRKIWYERYRGFQWAEDNSQEALELDQGKRNVPSFRDAMRWFMHIMHRYRFYPFESLGVWCGVAAVLQVLVLVILTFEDPGHLNADSKTLRFISNNIDEHRGYGAAMVLVFLMSYVPLMIPDLVRPWLTIMQFLGLFAAAFGGCFVVIFHAPDGWMATMHLVGAVMFVLGGVALHIAVWLDMPSLHRVRDLVLAGCAVLSGGTFFGTILAMHINNLQHTTHPTVQNVSAAAEYLLYVTVCVLDLVVAERIMEHAAFRLAISVQAATSNNTVRSTSLWFQPYMDASITLDCISCGISGAHRDV